ncbi:MAG TPA: hypothetical protein DDW90_07455 [Cyanobacteria bacterium UBA9971]|nr:hypothetical protein [Cyanobacteria bacterium UBA9971]
MINLVQSNYGKQQVGFGTKSTIAKEIWKDLPLNKAEELGSFCLKALSDKNKNLKGDFFKLDESFFKGGMDDGKPTSIRGVFTQTEKVFFGLFSKKTVTGITKDYYDFLYNPAQTIKSMIKEAVKKLEKPKVEAQTEATFFQKISKFKDFIA